MKREEVHLANIDAEVKFSYSMLELTVRQIACIGVVAPLALLLLTAQGLPSMVRFGGPLFVLVIGWFAGKVEREKVFIGTFLFYKAIEPLLPRAIKNGKPVMARIRTIGVDKVALEELRLPNLTRHLQRFIPMTPRADQIGDGLFHVAPGGWRVALVVQAPAVGTHSDEYGHWVQQVVEFIESVGEPAHFTAFSEHFDSVAVREAFDSSYRGPANGMLRDLERELVGRAASTTLSLRHLLVFSPGSVNVDGVPYSAAPFRTEAPPECTRAQAEHVLERARNILQNHGIEAEPADHETLSNMLAETPLLCRSAVKLSNGQVKIGREFHSYITTTGLPQVADGGAIVRMLLKVRMRGAVNLYISPVNPKVAIRKIESTRKSFSFSADQTGGDAASSAKARSAGDLVEHLISKQKSAHMISLTFDVRAHSPKECDELVEKVMDDLTTKGMEPVLCTSPGFLPALSAAPGATPLKRGLMMQTDGVAACLVPAQGTPFGDITEPFLGINEQTGTPAHVNVFRGRDEQGRRNANVLCAGATGSGKSVAMKLMAYRHGAQGVRVVAIDPHSEWAPVINALGGTYVDLMDHSINVLAAAADASLSPDLATSEIMPALAVMGGDEVSVDRKGRPVRRLPAQSRGWLHQEVAAFIEAWRSTDPSREPVISDLLRYMETNSVRNTFTDTEQERCRSIMYSLRTYTQGRKAEIFDRPMSFSLGAASFGIGLRRLGDTYASDLTPALAIIITWLYRELERLKIPMIIVVDEAHQVTGDPDAGAALENMVRSVRKYGAAVWMASQQIDDFLATELGRTLAGQAATKVVLGLEDSMAKPAQAAMNLSDTEVRALTHRCPRGRAVIISGRERGVVRFDRGALARLVDTEAQVSVG